MFRRQRGTRPRSISRDMREFRALVAESLAAAAGQIYGLVETKMLQTPGNSGEQRRELVRRRLSVAAEEIYQLLERRMMTGEEEEEEEEEEGPWRPRLVFTQQTDSLVGSGGVTVSPSESIRRHQEASEPPQKKDTSTQTDSDFSPCTTSHPRRSQLVEKCNSTLMETERGMCSVVPPGDKEVLSSTHLEAGREDFCKTCRRPFRERLAGHETKNHEIALTAAGRTTRQSCCRVCGKSFRYERSFLKHILRHAQNTDLCGICGKRVDTDERLKVHLQTHYEEKSCRDQPDDKVLAKGSGAESKDGDSGEDWKECDSDDGDSETSHSEQTKSQILNKRKRLKNRDTLHLKFCCKVCDKAFCYRASFLKHVQEDERNTNLCGKRFECEETLRLHLETYIRTNDCEVCGKHFDSHKQLEMHVRTHTGKKPYICSVCGKAFAQNGNLMGHMRGHTGEKPYACSVCGQSFSFKEYMMAHMRIHTGEKPFLCSVCGKGFRQRGTLKTHMMIHTGESMHRCGVCDKKFYKSGALKIHMRSHTGEKPYLCNACGKRFSASGSLSKHMGVHEGRRKQARTEDLKRHGQTSKRPTSL